jgi:hypothetical protein
VNALTRHHDHNFVLIVVGAVGESAEASGPIRPHPIKGAASSAVHLVTHVPICCPGASDVNVAFGSRVLGNELAK